MIAKIKVLVEGMVEYKDKDYCCWSTVVLIIDGDKKMIVDPGTVKSQDIILQALKKENLAVDDITHVFITHSHLDHYRNIGMFPRAKSVDFWGVWEEDKLFSNEWSKEAKFTKGNFSENIQIVKTPGHDDSSLTFFVRGQSVLAEQKVEGIIAICGDVFWKKDYPDLENLEDESYATDGLVLKNSRNLVLENADYVIPGHEGMYKVGR